MPSNTKTSDFWRARFAEVASLDGSAWETANQRLQVDWRRAYEAAFIECAASRGWSREEIGSYPSDMSEDAYVDRAHDDPCEQARRDVIESEDAT